MKDNKLQFISSLNANFVKLLNKQFGTSISTQFKDNLAQIQQQESVYQYQWQEVPDRYEVSQEPDDQKPKNLLDCHKKCIRKNSCHIINNKLAGLQKEDYGALFYLCLCQTNYQSPSFIDEKKSIKLDRLCKFMF